MEAQSTLTEPSHVPANTEGRSTGLLGRKYPPLAGPRIQRNTQHVITEWGRNVSPSPLLAGEEFFHENKAP